MSFLRSVSMRSSASITSLDVDASSPSSRSSRSSHDTIAALRVVVPRIPTRDARALCQLTSQPCSGLGNPKSPGKAAMELWPDAAPSSHRSSKIHQAQSFIVQKLARVSSRALESHMAHDSVRFHVRQFIMSYAIQLFLPIVALAWACCGRLFLLRNTEMSPTMAMCYIQTARFVMVGLVAAYCLTREHGKHPSVSDAALWRTMMEYLLIEFVAALAFAYMPRNTYRWWTTGKKSSRGSTRDPVPDDTRQREHTCSWMFATECQVRAELYSTARRLGVDVDATCFAILQPVAPRLPGVLQAQHANDFTPMHLVTQPRQQVSVADIAIEVLRHATNGNPLRHRALQLSALFGFVHAACTSPITHSLLRGTVARDFADPMAIAATALLLAADWVFVATLLLFGFAALADYQRAHDALAELTRQCQYTSQLRGSGGVRLPSKPPRLSLLLTDNVFSFLVTRRLLLNVGVRFRKRLQCFTSVLLVVAGSVLMIALASLVGSPGSVASSWHTLVDVVYVVVLLVACLVKGASTNKLTQQHVALLDSRALEITHALTAYRRPVDDEPRMADTAKAQLEDCLKALTVVTKQLMHDHTLRAVTLLGVRATPAAARTMAACCITCLSFVVRVLMVAAADKANSQDIL